MESEPTVITNDGTQVWRNDKDELHREDGPAVIYPDGTQKWYINDELHREDGPAEIYPDGEQHWHINGHEITDELHKWAKDRDIDLNNLSEIDNMVIAIEWCNYGK